MLLALLIAYLCRTYLEVAKIPNTALCFLGRGLCEGQTCAVLLGREELGRFQKSV